MHGSIGAVSVIVEPTLERADTGSVPPGAADATPFAFVKVPLVAVSGHFYFICYFLAMVVVVVGGGGCSV